MKKKLVYTATILIAIILQVSVLSVVFDNHASANLVLMMILAWSVLDGFYAFIAWAITAGILYDLAAYSPVGEHVLIFLIAIYFVSFFSKRLSLEHKGVSFILFSALIIISTIFSKTVVAFETVWKMQAFYDFWKAFGSFYSVIIQIFFNEILFFIWLFLLKKIKEFFSIETS
jgi:rod shape-determining protein MreD